MSSFVVNKEIYIRAAGITAGIAEAKKLWLYDYVTGRNMTPEDYYRNFTECYDMNAISVQEQYRDADRETDSNDYMTVFKEYRRKAQQIATRPDQLKDLIMNLRGFFKCAEYQTEKEPYYFKMQSLFNRINTVMMPLLWPEDRDGWPMLEL